MNKIPDKIERNLYPKCCTFKYYHRYHRSYINYLFKIINNIITRCCVCDIVVPDSIAVIRDFE